MLPACATQIATIDGWWRKFSPYPESGTAFFACVLAEAAWFPLNLLYPHTVAVSRLHARNRTNALDKFLHDAAYESLPVGSIVSATLFDPKLYVRFDRARQLRESGRTEVSATNATATPVQRPRDPSEPPATQPPD